MFHVTFAVSVSDSRYYHSYGRLLSGQSARLQCMAMKERRASSILVVTETEGGLPMQGKRQVQAYKAREVGKYMRTRQGNKASRQVHAYKARQVGKYKHTRQGK